MSGDDAFAEGYDKGLADGSDTQGDYYRGRIKQLQEAGDTYQRQRDVYIEGVGKLEAHVEQLEAQQDAMREALEFYRDEWEQDPDLMARARGVLAPLSQATPCAKTKVNAPAKPSTAQVTQHYRRQAMSEKIGIHFVLEGADYAFRAWPKVPRIGEHVSLKNVSTGNRETAIVQLVVWGVREQTAAGQQLECDVHILWDAPEVPRTLQETSDGTKRG